jgi:hypothetical protein
MMILIKEKRESLRDMEEDRLICLMANDAHSRRSKVAEQPHQ